MIAAVMHAHHEVSRQFDHNSLQQALDDGGRDNVTVIVAAYRLPEQERDRER